MPVRNGQMTAMQMLIDIEAATAVYYRRCADCFPEHRPFWTTLAYEEDGHAIWVRNLLAKLQQGTLTFRDGRFTPDTFQTFLTYLRGRLSEIEAQCPSLDAAFAIAIDIEEAFVERGFFVIFDSDDPRLRTTLQRLSADSAAHLQRVRAYQQALRV